MARRLTLVGFFVVIEQGSMMQLMIGTAFSACYMLLQMQVAPYTETTDDFLANSCSFALLAFFLCCIVFKLGTLTELPSVQAVMTKEQGRDFSIPSATLSAIVAMSVLGVLVVSSVVLVVQLALARARIRREAAAKLPTCAWQLADDQHYIAFLSHYKVEAGAQVLAALPHTIMRSQAVPSHLSGRPSFDVAGSVSSRLTCSPLCSVWRTRRVTGALPEGQPRSDAARLPLLSRQ
jgi:hypothetical protein